MTVTLPVTIAPIWGVSPLQPDSATMTQITLIVFLAVLVMNSTLLTIWGVRRLFLEKPTFRRDWSFLDLWLMPQVILTTLLISLIPLFVLHPAISSTEAMMRSVSFVLPMLFLQNIVFFGVPAAFVFLKYRLPLREIGLPPLPKRREVLMGIGLGLAAIAVSLPLEMGLTALANQFSYLPWVAAGLKMEQALPINALIESVTKQGWGVLLLAALAIGPGPGFGEEMLFRGFLFGLLRRRWGLWPGVIVSGFVFAAVHGYFIGFLPVFLFGMALAALYHRTGSLWVGIIVHATNNSVLVLLAYLFPNLT
ncbi:MAG: CPBP family intramembrane metalloprotease [Cytophagales bacterium]|nr:CPBP family intramembrane metalloprotease [Armatimonadota bacterium]